MRVIFGIGNPGHRYSNNRHNAGFLLLDFVASQKSLSFLSAKGDYHYAKGIACDTNFLLIKPTTFVNNCGFASKQVTDEYDLPIEDFLVVCDDTSLDLGTVRVRLSGGDGGHNGLASIIYNLNSNGFPRIRIGVGQSLNKNGLVEYVLSDFTTDEVTKLRNIFEKATSLIDEFISGGSKAMLDLNSKMN